MRDLTRSANAVETNKATRVSRSVINWQEAYTRLEQIRQAVGTGGLSPEEARRILKERAQVLAQPPEEVETPAEVLGLLVFSLDRERYGVEPTHVLDVAPLRRLTRIPDTPPFVLGVMNYLGTLRPVLDLRRFLDYGAQGGIDGKWVVTVETGGMMFGIACNAVAGMVRVGAQDLAPPPAAIAAGRRAFIRGVTKDMVTVLDLEALTQDPRIVVNDEIG